jgi:hypothetical protein
MHNLERLNKLEFIFLNSNSKKNKIYALRQLLQNYVGNISNDILFKMIPCIWEGADPPTFRWRIEWEIKNRKEEDVLMRLVNLFKTDNPYYWFFAAEMLFYFPDYRIVEPLIKLIEFSDNKVDRWTKRTAMYALSHITKEELAKIPLDKISNFEVVSIIKNFEKYFERIHTEYKNN